MAKGDYLKNLMHDLESHTEVRRFGSGWLSGFFGLLFAIAGFFMVIALRFPDWFGGNWDALADALADLSWLPEGGQLLLFDNAWDWRERDGEDFAVLLDICGEAAQGWTRERRPFWAVIPLAPEQLALVGREDDGDE